MSLSAITALDKDVTDCSTDCCTKSRIEIPVTGSYDQGSTEGPLCGWVDGTAVFEDRELNHDSRFTYTPPRKGTDLKPAAISNLIVRCKGHENNYSIIWVERDGDKDSGSFRQRIYLKPSSKLNEEQASLLKSFKNTDSLKVQGRDDEGNWIAETIVGGQEVE